MNIDYKQTQLTTKFDNQIGWYLRVSWMQTLCVCVFVCEADLFIRPFHSLYVSVFCVHVPSDELVSVIIKTADLVDPIMLVPIDRVHNFYKLLMTSLHTFSCMA